MEAASLGLEPQWLTTPNGARVDVLAQVVIWDSAGQKHLIRSAIEGKFLTLTADLEANTAAVTILQGIVSSGHHGLHITAVNHQVMSHFTPTQASLDHAIEVCCGISALGEGLTMNGMEVKVRNDLRKKFTDLLTHQGFQAAVQGDIGFHNTLLAIHKEHGDPTWITAGFPCQPWSRLGDRQASNDGRAHTLIAILRCAFFLRAHSLLLECVCEARQDRKVKEVICAFCKMTRYNVREIELKLQDTWPSRRDRWWVLITFAGSKIPTLEPMPKFEPAPIISDILPYFPQWPDDENHQLMVGPYEFRIFEECGGICNKMVNLNEPLWTSLHGWGNQLEACPCECRLAPMKMDRLKKGGLHGAFIAMGGTTIINGRNNTSFDISILGNSVSSRVSNQTDNGCPFSNSAWLG